VKLDFDTRVFVGTHFLAHESDHERRLRSADNGLGNSAKRPKRCPFVQCDTFETILVTFQGIGSGVIVSACRGAYMIDFRQKVFTVKARNRMARQLKYLAGS
jgi:hypothetical protein